MALAGGTLLLLEGISTLFMSLGLLSTIFRYRDTKNPLDLGATVVVSSLAIDSILYFLGLIQLQIIGNSFYSSTVIGHLTFESISYIFIGMTFSWFMFYIQDMKRWYSVPIITGILSIDLIIRHNMFGLFDNFLIWSIALAVIVLLRNGIKNHLAISFALGITGLLFMIYIGATTINPELKWIKYIIVPIGGIAIILAENGWMDDNIFYDRKERKQIQSVWINKMIAK